MNDLRNCRFTSLVAAPRAAGIGRPGLSDEKKSALLSGMAAGVFF